MVLVNPAGLMGEDRLPNVLGRFILKNAWNVLSYLREKGASEQVQTGLVEGGKYVAQNPVRAITEVSQVASARIEDLLLDLHSQGIGIVIIHGVQDMGFPMDRIQKTVVSDTEPFGFVDGFLSVQGGHDELYIHPEQYAGAAEQMFSALEKKKKKRQ